ncbi:MAG: hypothetical protein GX610_10860 [Rhodococcus sp.]|nr:hypothetical protein [Rhodococcus sp. (in: high G+C Gram-positive bacteria)]
MTERQKFVMALLNERPSIAEACLVPGLGDDSGYPRQEATAQTVAGPEHRRCDAEAGRRSLAVGPSASLVVEATTPNDGKIRQNSSPPRAAAAKGASPGADS